MIASKVKKLPLVDADGTLIGLITARDLIKHKQLPFATRDAQGRLRVGAAIGASATISSARPRWCAPAPTSSWSTSRTGIRW